MSEKNTGDSSDSDDFKDSNEFLANELAEARLEEIPVEQNDEASGQATASFPSAHGTTPDSGVAGSSSSSDHASSSRAQTRGECLNVSQEASSSSVPEGIASYSSPDSKAHGGARRKDKYPQATTSSAHGTTPDSGVAGPSSSGYHASSSDAQNIGDLLDVGQVASSSSAPEGIASGISAPVKGRRKKTRSIKKNTEALVTTVRNIFSKNSSRIGSFLRQAIKPKSEKFKKAHSVEIMPEIPSSAESTFLSYSSSDRNQLTASGSPDGDNQSNQNLIAEIPDETNNLAEAENPNAQNLEDENESGTEKQKTKNETDESQ